MRGTATPETERSLSLLVSLLRSVAISTGGLAGMPGAPFGHRSIVSSGCDSTNGALPGAVGSAVCAPALLTASAAPSVANKAVRRSKSVMSGARLNIGNAREQLALPFARIVL